MRMRSCALLALVGLLVLGTSALGEVTTRVALHWADAEFALRPGPAGTVAVRLAGGVSAAEPGQPDLPWMVVTVPLPAGVATVAGWSFEPEPANPPVPGIVPTPAQRDLPSEAGGPVSTAPDPAVYAGASPWPADPVRFRGVQTQAGRAEAAFLVCPLRWDPRSHDLERLPGGTLTVRFGSGPAALDVVTPLRPVAADLFGADASPKAGGGAVVHSLRGGLSPTARPSLDSVPVEFLVVTNEELAPAFQPLIDWKNRTGFPAAVRTVEAISRDYPQGVDLAESVRLFLRDAYALWGTRVVIIGGDPSIVPIRYGRSYAYNLPTGVSIATDYYYACLDGNWNADGDNLWGEAPFQNVSMESDKADMVAELRVGRVSAVDTSQVGTWVRKYLKYTRDPDPTPGYLNGVLTLGEVLFAPEWRLGDADTCSNQETETCVRLDGATECFLMIDTLRASTLGSFFYFDELYEREYWWNPRRGITAGQLNRANTLASLNAGRNIVYQMGHGDRDRWAIGTGRLLTSDVANTTNGPRYSGLAYVVNCNSAAVDADCVGEAWQFARNGGGVNYLGSTNLDFPATAREFQNSLLPLWMNNVQQTCGSAYQTAAQLFATRQGDNEGTVRFLLTSLILLGDPDLNIWRTQPRAMQVTAPAEFTIGSGTARVNVKDSESAPLAGARVTLYKAGDALGVALTDGEGNADVPFAPTSDGPFLLTVTHPMARPHQGGGDVQEAEDAWPVASNYTIVDDGSGGTRGNGNGRIEIGETVAFNLSVGNPGGPATGVVASLRRAEAVPGVQVAFADSTEEVGDLTGGGTATRAGAFLLTVRATGPVEADAADRVALPLLIDWQAQGGTHTQRIAPEVDRPELELINTARWETELPPGGEADSIPDQGESMAVTVELFNQGRGSWHQLRARLETMIPGSVAMLDSLATIPPLEPGTSVVSEALTFHVTGHLGLSFRLRLVVEDLTGETPQTVWSRYLYLRRLPTVPPPSFQTLGRPNSVSLAWGRPTTSANIWGYRVYRADSVDGTFLRLPPGYVKSTRYLEDDGLPDMTRFWYQVAVVDSSGIEGPRTEPTVASSAPGLQAGWPVSMEESRDACPTIENLNGWGRNEVLALSKSVYCLDANAGDYYDGDAIPSTRGVLTKEADGQNFNGKCAVADLTGDGIPEVIALATNNMDGGWNPPATLCVFDHVGHLLWSRVVANRPASSAPAIGNIDNDPEPEIVFLCGRWVFAYNHDGTPLGDIPGGKLYDIPGPESGKNNFQYCSPALEDLDGDGRDEIVFTTNADDDQDAYARLYVINGMESPGGGDPVYGSDLPGFPFVYGYVATGQFSYASPAIADVTKKVGESVGDADTKPDIVITTKSRLWVFDPWASGVNKLAWTIALEPQAVESPLNSSPAIGDVDGDGDLDIAVAGGKGYLYVVNGRDGGALPGFIEAPNERYRRVAPASTRLGSPILADLDGVVDKATGKRLPEIIIGDFLGTVYALRSDGEGMNGFPFSVPGGKIGIGLAAWDIDRDGFQNLVIQADKVQELQVLDFNTCPFDPDDAVANPWPAFRHDPRNTGSVYEPPGPTPVEVLALEAQAGPDGIALRFRTELNVRTFVLLRAEESGGDWVTVGEWAAEEAAEEPGAFVLRDTPPAGTWRYRIDAYDFGGEIRLSGETVVTAGASLAFRLHPARPNPFNPHTLFKLDLPRTTECDLRVVDPSGRTVRRLLAGRFGPGTVESVWDGNNDAGRPVGSGVFFVRASAEGLGDAVQKVVLLK